MGDAANRVRRTSVSRVETADSMSGSIPYRYRAFLNWSRVAGAFWSHNVAALRSCAGMALKMTFGNDAWLGELHHFCYAKRR